MVSSSTTSTSQEDRQASSLVFSLESAENNSTVARATVMAATKQWSPRKSKSPTESAKPRRSSRSTSSSSSTTTTPTTKERIDIDTTTTRRRSNRSNSTTTTSSRTTTRNDKHSTHPKDNTTTTTTPTNARSRSRSQRSTSFRSTIKPPSSPKEPMSAYDFYKLDVLPQLEKDHPKLSKNQLEKKLQQEWKKKKSSSTTRNNNRYVDMEKEDKLRYEMELHQYNSILQDHHHHHAAAEEEETSPSSTAKGPTGMAPAAKRTSEVSTTTTTASTTKPKLKSRGTQTKEKNMMIRSVQDDDETVDEEEEEVQKPVVIQKNFWKPSQFKNRNRFKLLEQHRKFRRQKMAARQKGILFSSNKPSYNDDTEEEKKSTTTTDNNSSNDYRTAHCEDWEIERILGKRACFQEDEFLVRWKGKDPSWDSWETIGTAQEKEGKKKKKKKKNQNFWTQVQIYMEQEEIRKELMEMGAKELGLEAFSLVEDLEEIQPKSIVRTSAQEEASKSASHQPVLASAETAAAETAMITLASKSDAKETRNSTDVQEAKQGAEATAMELETTSLAAAETVTMTAAAKSKEKETTNSTAAQEAKQAAETTMMELEAPSLTAAETAAIMPASESKEKETTNNTQEATQDAKIITMMEVETQPKSSLNDAETTTASAMANAQIMMMDLDTEPELETQPEFATQPDLNTQPESCFDPFEITMTGETDARSPTAMETDAAANPASVVVAAPNVQGANSEVAATTTETDTETEITTEPTLGSATTTADDSPTKATPLRTLTMAAFGHRESEWSEEPEASSSSSGAKASNNSTIVTTPTATATNETTTAGKAAVPVTIEATATPRAEGVVEETVVIDDDGEETEDDDTPNTKNTSAVTAEAVTPADEKSTDTLPPTTSGANGATKASSTMEDKSALTAVDNSESSYPDQEKAASSSMKQPSTEPQETAINDVVTEVRGMSDLNNQKRPLTNGVQPKYRKRRRTPRVEKQWDDDRSTLFQVPSADDMNFRDVPRVSVFDIDAKQIVTEAREKGYPIVLTNLRGHPQFATRWLKRWNGRNREVDSGECLIDDGDPQSHQHEELLDLSLPHELDIVRMIEDIGQESVPILKKNYSETKPIVKETFAENFLWKCWPRNGQEPAIKGLYLHQWQFPRSETAASKLCGHGNCSTIPNGIVGEDLLQFWLDGKDNPYQYIFMGGADTFSKLHKDSGGLDITIAPIVGEKECVMVHRLDESYLYGMKSKLDNVNLRKYPMTAHARVWKTVVEPGELLWMPANTFHQCRNVTPCLSYHRFHLDTINLQQFFNSLFVGDATEIEHDEVIWNGTIELLERMEKFLKDYRQQPKEPLPEHIAETASTLSYLRPLCREIAVAFDPSCKQVHFRPSNRLFRSKQEINARCWNQVVHDIDLTLHDFNNRDEDEIPTFELQAVRSVPKPPEMEDPKVIQKGLDLLQDSSSTNKEESTTGTSALQKLYDKLPAIQPFQEGVVIPDSIQLKSNDKIIFRIGEKQCTGYIIKIEDQLRTVHLAYSRLPSYYDEYMPVDTVLSEHSVPGSPTKRKKQMVSCAIGGKGKPAMATVQSMKVATFYLVRFSTYSKSVKLQRWLCRDSIISKEN